MKFNRKLIASGLTVAMGLSLVAPVNAQVLTPSYDEASYYSIATTAYSRMVNFEKGTVAVANQAKQYGLMNEAGEMVVDFQYDGLTPLPGGLYKVQKIAINDNGWDDSRYGLIDATGKEVYPITASFISVENNTIEISAPSADGDWGYDYAYYTLNMTPSTQEAFWGESSNGGDTTKTYTGFEGSRSLSYYNDDYILAYNNEPDGWNMINAAIYDGQGNLLIAQGDYTNVSLVESDEGDAFVLTTATGTSLVGTNGTVIVPEGTYSSLRAGWNKNEPISVETADGQKGLLNCDGTVLVPVGNYMGFGNENAEGYIAAQCYEWDDNYCPTNFRTDLYKDGVLIKAYEDKMVFTEVYYRDLGFTLDGVNNGMMDLEGNVLIEASYSAINPGENGDLITTKPISPDSWENYYGLYTVDGVQLLDTVYPSIYGVSSAGLYRVNDGTNNGLYSSPDKGYKIPLAYQEMRIHTLNFIELYDGNTYTMVNRDNKAVLPATVEGPAFYDSSNEWFSWHLEKFDWYAADADGYDSNVIPMYLNGTTYYVDYVNGRNLGSMVGNNSNIDPQGRFVSVNADGSYRLGQTEAPYWATQLAYASNITTTVDGVETAFDAYALKDEAGNFTTYLKLRDVADVLNGTQAQFNVTWDNAVNIATNTAYVANGTENSTPYYGNQIYMENAAPTNLNGAVSALESFVINDSNGNGYTYYKLRDLGEAIGFNVRWDVATSTIVVESNVPYAG